MREVGLIQKGGCQLEYHRVDCCIMPTLAPDNVSLVQDSLLGSEVFPEWHHTRAGNVALLASLVRSDM